MCGQSSTRASKNLASFYGPWESWRFGASECEGSDTAGFCIAFRSFGLQRLFGIRLQLYKSLVLQVGSSIYIYIYIGFRV